MRKQPRCEKCDRPIEWIQHDGKGLALDARAPTYEFVMRGEVGYYVRSSARVAHWIVCPGRKLPENKESEGSSRPPPADPWWTRY